MRASMGLVVVITALGAGYVSARYENYHAEQAEAEYEASVAPPKARMRAMPQPQREEPEEECAQMPMRDAVAMPQAAPALAAARAVPMLPPAAAVLPRRAPASDTPTISADSMKSLVTQPMTYIAQKTWLGKPAGFMKFVSDPKRVQGYVGNPVVKAVIDSPALTRRLIANPMILSAFLSSPAMRDPAAMRALASSPLLKELAQHKGVQAALMDPAFMQSVVMNPQVMKWMTTSPDAATLFTKMRL